MIFTDIWPVISCVLLLLLLLLQSARERLPGLIPIDNRAAGAVVKSHVRFHMGNFTWLFTCEISHVKFHMWNFTCEISHVKIHVWFTREISHVKLHMWFTREISHVKFHMWKYMCFTCIVTCEVPITHVKRAYSRVFHMGFTCVSHAFSQG